MNIIKRNSTTHTALLYLKMKNNWISKNDLFKLSPAKYQQEYRAKRALDQLVFHNFAIIADNMYHITQIGKDVCYAIPKEQYSYHHE